MFATFCPSLLECIPSGLLAVIGQNLLCERIVISSALGEGMARTRVGAKGEQVGKRRNGGSARQTNTMVHMESISFLYSL